MHIRGTCNCSSSRRSQATGELDLFDTSRLIPDLDQHDPVLDSNHHSRVLLFICISVEIQTTDPAAVINFGGPKGWTELR